jgi:hypothetical protein
MISRVAGNGPNCLRAGRQQPAEPDALTTRRAEESRQLAIAAVNQQQREKVRLAVSAYISFGVSCAADAPRPAKPLANAKAAYGEF